MPPLATALLDIKRLEEMAAADSPIHRLDARAKVMVTLIFSMTVISFDRYELSALFPFFVYPAAMIARSTLPPLFILRKVLLLCPFVLCVALFNPLLDRTVVMQFGSWGISGGWLSFCSIIIRSLLTVGAALILLGVTGFTAICQALEKLGVPQLFAVQLLFLYRYLFVLAEEGKRAAAARELRSFGNRGRGIRSYGSMIGYLMLRTWQRAERIHRAMLARGFAGEFHGRSCTRFGRAEAAHLAGWSAAFFCMRIENVASLLGRLVLGGAA